ncbi:WD40-repeat-containing domain, partial [Trinorchestia longiramus]
RQHHCPQARWVSTLSHRHLLVVTGRAGVVFYNWDGSILLKGIRLGGTEATAPPQTGTDGGLFCRGIAELDGQVVVGEVVVLRTGEGRILRVSYADDFEEEVPDGDDEGVGVESVRFQWRPHAVAALASCGRGQLAVGDVRGNIMVGKAVGDSVDKLWEIESYGSAVSCLACVGDLLLGGYLSGHLRVFSLSTRSVLAEICAHGRAVTGLDAVEGVGERELLRGVSVGEDTFVRVWGLHKEDDAITK